MDVLSVLAAALVFSAACNVDTVILAMGYAARGVHIPTRGAVILALVTTAVTYLSLLLGQGFGSALPGGGVRAAGGVVLMVIGAWFCLDFLRHPAPEEVPAVLPASASGWVSLAAALAVNNAGAGVAAGAGGLNAPAAALASFLCTLLALPLGRWLGRGPAGRLLGRFALPLSGVLLLALGAFSCLP